MSSVSELVSYPRPGSPRTDVLGGGVTAGGGADVVVTGEWIGVLAAGWVIWSREGKRRYVESPSVARRLPDLGAPEEVVLSTRNSKARQTIVQRFRTASPAPSMAANSAATRPSSSLVPSPGIIVCRRPQVGVMKVDPSAHPTVGSRRLGGSCSARIVQRRCRPSRLRP